jgi:hypothetical protein
LKALLLTLCLFGAPGARAQAQPDQLPPLAACQALCEDLLNDSTISAVVTKKYLGVLRWVKRLQCAEEYMSHSADEVANVRLWLVQHPGGDYSDAALCMSKNQDWKGCFEDGC